MEDNSKVDRPMIDLTTARRLAREVVAEAGEDYVYKADDPMESCYYIELDMSPGCVVGRMLAKHGYSDKFLRALHGSVGTVCTVRPGIMTGAAAEYLQALQSRQDSRNTWGASLEYAEEFLRGAEFGAYLSNRFEIMTEARESLAVKL